MKKMFSLMIVLVMLINCTKTNTMQEKLFPERPFEKANIDKFYWATEGWDYAIVPLIKTFHLIKLQGDNKWEIFTGLNKTDEIGVSEITNFNIFKACIYGYKAPVINESDSNFNLPEYWFIIDTKKGVKTESTALTKFDKVSDFKTKLRKIDLPVEFLFPDKDYKQFKNNPILPWFAEDIKKQL